MSFIAEGCCAVCTNQIASSQSYPGHSRRSLFHPDGCSSTWHCTHWEEFLFWCLGSSDLGGFFTVCRSILRALLIAHQTKPLFNLLKREPLCSDQHSDKTVLGKDLQLD